MSYQSIFWLLLLLPAWLLTTYSTRKLQVVIAHHCAHANFSGRKWIDQNLGRFICVALWLRDFDSYQKDHILHHKAKTALTFADETVKFLYLGVGLRPGMSKNELWRKLCTSLCSPIFHYKSLKARFSACFLSHSLIHNVTAWVFWGVIVLSISSIHFWSIFLVAWVLPVTILYQIAQCLRLAAEHKWPENMSERDKLFVSHSTVAIFLGEPVPPLTLPIVSRIARWVIWCIRMSGHLVIRLCVLQTDTPTHDYHTRYPGTDDWANASYARQQDLDNGCPRWPELYQETWGLLAAIDGVLESLSKQPTEQSAEAEDAVNTE